MMRRLPGNALMAVVLGMASAATQAHHSFSAEFDINKTVTVTGKVVSMRWSNPHAWIYIDAQGPDGKVVHWAFESATANALYRRGWRKEDLLPGTVVTAEGWRARNGTPTANTNVITLSDGRKLFSGSAPAQGATEQR